MTFRGGEEISSATLHTTTDASLADERTRETVLASLHGIAERTGVDVCGVAMNDQGLEVQVSGPEIIVIGLLAELRRTTDHWHHQKNGTPLWVSPPGDAH